MMFTFLLLRPSSSSEHAQQSRAVVCCLVACIKKCCFIAACIHSCFKNITTMITVRSLAELNARSIIFIGIFNAWWYRPLNYVIFICTHTQTRHLLSGIGIAVNEGLNVRVYRYFQYLVTPTFKLCGILMYIQTHITCYQELPDSKWCVPVTTPLVITGTHTHTHTHTHTSSIIRKRYS